MSYRCFVVTESMHMPWTPRCSRGVGGVFTRSLIYCRKVKTRRTRSSAHNCFINSRRLCKLYL